MISLKVGEQPTVRLVARTHHKQLVAPFVQIGDLQVELVSIDHVLLAPVAERERVLEDSSGDTRNARLTRHGVGDQLAGPVQQVRVADPPPVSSGATARLERTPSISAR